MNDTTSKGTSARPYVVLEPRTDVVMLTLKEVEEIAHAADEETLNELMDHLEYGYALRLLGEHKASKPEAAARAAYTPRAAELGNEGELVAVAAGALNRVPYKPNPEPPVVFGK